MTAPAHTLRDAHQNETSESLGARVQPRRLSGWTDRRPSAPPRTQRERKEKEEKMSRCPATHQKPGTGRETFAACCLEPHCFASPTCLPCAFKQTGGLPGLDGLALRAQSGQTEGPWQSSPGCRRKVPWPRHHSKRTCPAGLCRGHVAVRGLADSGSRVQPMF